MRGRTLLLVSAIALSLLAWMLLGNRRTPVAARPASAPAAVPAADAEARARAEEAYASQTGARIEELAKMEAEQKKRARAAAESVQARTAVQSRHDTAWSIVVTTNWQRYQALREKMEQSHAHSAHCTICDGNGLMPFCVLCEGTGKCPACRGTGQLYGDQYCSVCLGKGKCHLCFGSGRMACPFCDDGTIYVYTPVPARRIPLAEAAGPQPVPRKEAVQNLERVESPPAQVAAAAAQSDDEPGAAPPPARAPERSNSSLLQLEVAVCLLGSVFLFRRLAPALGNFLNDHFNPWTARAATGAAVSTSVPDEDTSFSEFAAAFRDMSASRVPDSSNADVSGSSAGSLAAFFESAPERIAAMRSLFSEVSRAPNEAARQKILIELSVHLRLFRFLYDHPLLLGLVQLAAALEGLVKQIAEGAAAATPSTFRTAAGGIILLETLSKPGIRLEAPSSLRFLVVDDDAISRRAVCSALKKAFNEPEAAENGEAALALAAQNAYDVIFLDADMPGMDGFETCRRIHQTEANRNTPVVFVTLHADFNSRAKSAESGGHDLIAKPFLAFEITVKALTLVMRAREPRSTATKPTALHQTSFAAA